MEKQMESLNFKPYQDGFYMRDMGDVEIWVKTKIIVSQKSDKEAVELFDYSFERLEKLLEVII